MKAQKHNNNQKKSIPSKPLSTSKEELGFMAKNKEILLLAMVVIITFIVYSPALHNSFNNWDDNDYITDNPYIKALTSANIEHIFTKPIALNYHPLTMLSLALNFKLSGLEPFSYYFVNILFHLFNTLLAFYFAFLIFSRKKLPALFVAAIFAIHPMHVESVAWISERKDVLYTFFFLAALTSWIWFIEKRKWVWFMVTLVLYGLSALSKPSAVVFPLVLLLIDYFYKRKLNFQLLLEKIPYFAISIAIGIATLNAQIDTAVVDMKHYNALQQFLFASFGVYAYIIKLIVPTGLSALHPVPGFNNSMQLTTEYYIAPIFNLLIIGLVVYSLKFTRLVVFGFLFYFINILLTLQFVQVGSAVIAERYTYLSYIGLLLGLAWLLNQIYTKYPLPKYVYSMVLILFFGILAFLSVQRVAVWKNSGTLWTDVISKYPQSYTAYNNRAYYNVQQKNYDKALPDFNRAIELSPNYKEALNNRGSLYRLIDKPREAVADYTRVLALDPVYVKSLSGRGNAYASLGVLDSALADFNKAFELDPVVANALGDRGSVYFRLGKFENAVEDCSRKIAIDTTNAEAYLNRAVAYSSLQKWELAIKDYTVYLKAHPENPNAFEWRGVAFRSVGSYQPAINDFTTGMGLDPKKVSLYTNRAIAYKLAGMNKNATDDVIKARELGLDVSEQSLFSAIK
jgi:tetratricopeptide (TPR) repeat protein